MKMNWLWRGGDRPQDIPQWAFMYLVRTLNVDPDWLGQLKCVEQMSFEGDVPVNLIRVFDAKAVPKAIQIESFASLDRHPELILFEGYMEKEGGGVQIERRVEPAQQKILPS